MASLGSTSSAVATYTILAALQRGISFLILPFITYAMSPSDYGAASVLAAGSLLLNALMANPLTNLISRAAARDDVDGPALLRVAGVYCYVVLPMFAALIATVVALCVPRFLGVPGYIWGIELVAIGFQGAASTFALWVAQAREDPGRFATIAMTSVVATVLFKLIFVIVLREGVFGWAISDLLSAVTSAFLAMALVRLPHARVERKHIRYVLSFSLPLVPHSISLWALMFLSRPAMALVTPLDQVGLFSFALNLAQLAGLILTEANRGLLVRYAREKFPAPSNETIGPVQWQLLAALALPALVGCGVAIVGPRLFAEAYWPAFGITGILLGAQTAIGLYAIPMNYLTQTAGITRYSFLASGTGAAVLVGSILLFGREHGAEGVAIATTVAYFTMAGIAGALVVANKLAIDWRIWLPTWPAVAFAASALTLAVAAVRMPAGSNQGDKYAIASMVLICISAIVLKARGPKPVLSDLGSEER